MTLKDIFDHRVGRLIAAAPRLAGQSFALRAYGCTNHEHLEALATERNTLHRLDAFLDANPDLAALDLPESAAADLYHALAEAEGSP